jgi:hypothetical protein
MAAWMLLVSTHTRFWDGVEERMRRDHRLTMARYDVLAQFDMAGGRLGLSDLWPRRSRSHPRGCRSCSTGWKSRV